MLSMLLPLASAAERRAFRCRLRTTLLSRTSFQVVKPTQAGALTTPPLPESCRAASSTACIEGALERGLAGRERGVRGVQGQQRCVGLGPRDAGVAASKLRCDEGLGGETSRVRGLLTGSLS